MSDFAHNDKLIADLIRDVAEHASSSGVLYIVPGTSLHNGIRDAMKTYAMQMLRQVPPDPKAALWDALQEELDAQVGRDTPISPALFELIKQARNRVLGGGMPYVSGTGYPRPKGGFKYSGPERRK